MTNERGFCDRCYTFKSIKEFSNSQIKKSYSTKELYCKLCIRQMFNMLGKIRLKVDKHHSHITKEGMNKLNALVKQLNIK